MGKKRYYFIGIVIVLSVVGFKLHADKEQAIQPPQPDAAVLPPPYNPVSEIENTLSEFDSLLDRNLKESGTVGAAAVVVYKGKIALLKCYGVCKAGSEQPVTPNTVFRLASVSKSVTGILAGILDDENTLSLDARVVDYLPQFALKDSASTQQLKIKHLLSHTSGLIPHAYDLMVEDKVPLDKIIARLDEVDIAAAPGELYGYQNVLYSIYDPVLQAATGRSFASLLSEKVFIPFHMNDASTGFKAFKNNPNKAYPHYHSGHKHFAPMRLNDRYYTTAPAAGVNASISDLGQLLATLTNPNTDAISAKARNTVFTPQVKSLLSRTYFRCWGRDVRNKQYSIGWRTVDYKGQKIAYHGGYVLGYKAEIAYCPDQEFGIAYLCNSPNSTIAENIPTFLNLMFAEQQKMALKKNENNRSNSDKS